MKVQEAGATGVHDGLPVDSLRDAAPYLRRPFTPEAVKFKVQTVFKEAKGCIVVGYIDARLVIERLNLVAAGEWSDAYVPVDDKSMRCDLTVFGTTRPGFGVGAGIEPLKSQESDSLKRAAVKFGIGVSIYAVPQITLWASQPHVEPAGKSLRLTELGHTKLREGYGKWLRETGTPLFGAALDHGDTVGATFEEDDAPVFEPAPAAALEDDRAKELVAACREAYGVIAAKDPQQIPPARFNGMLAGAGHSHSELERLLAWLKERAA